jgi:hypothetical protein
LISGKDESEVDIAKSSLRPLSEPIRLIIRFLILTALSDNFFDDSEKTYIFEAVKEDIREELTEDEFEILVNEVKE